MPKFRVIREVDAYAYYSTLVEADTPEEAVQIASEEEHDLVWEDDGVVTFDDRRFYVDDKTPSQSS